ncbi:hypothetical protein BJ912DRAFT_1045151 [Pholiota molesta]|nr:hypothetical protein BJ912DRAFT_1045151 [Pholiota molesta]
MQTPNEPQATQSTEISAPTSATMVAVDTGISLANSVIAIVKEVGGMLKGVPYVQALSGVILQIIKIRDEIKSNKERCREIIEKVLRISKSIYERLADVAKSEGKEKLTRLEGHLGDCKSTLEAVHTELQKHQSRNPLAKLINRGLEELNMLDRRVDELKINLILDILVAIQLEQAATATNVIQSTALNAPTDSADHVLPPKPHLMVEREEQLNLALNILLRPEPSRIAIIGGGGFGKTTLARMILHEPEILERYQSQYFLSCEGISNIDSLLLGFGSMLGLNAAPSAILASARRLLGTSTTLVCFDNFETPWEGFETRTKIEELLESIADIPNLSLIITIRGEQRPLKVMWSNPLLPPLSTLSLDGAKDVLRTIASNHTVDDFTLQLLHAIDGIPLAVTLVSTLLRDGESSESLWGRWSAKYTKVIHTGGDDRQSNLNQSIAFSVDSLRMNKNASASRQLHCRQGPTRFPKLRTLLRRITRADQHTKDVNTSAGMPSQQSGMSDLHTILETLRAVALIRVDHTSTSPRLQMLSPIRLFCNEFLFPETLLVLENVANYYITMLEFTRLSNAECYAQVVPEIQNIHLVFQRVFKVGYSQDITRLITATSDLTDWSHYIGYLSQDTIQMALQNSVIFPIPHGRCLMSLGRLYHSQGQHTKAETYFRAAATLFKQAKDVDGEADALHHSGNMLFNLAQRNQSEFAFTTSLKLYTQTGNKGGASKSQGRDSEAQATLSDALEAYQQISDLLGHANVAQSLSNVHFIRGNLVKAEKYATEALNTAKQVNSARGEGNALQTLGCTYLGLDRVPESRQALEQALIIFKQQNTPIKQLNAIDDLAKVYIQSDQLSAAEALLTASSKVELDVIQIAGILTQLGWLYICGDHLDKAKPVLDDALQRFRRFDHKGKQAEVLGYLATVYFKSNRLDEAERALNSIPDLGTWINVEIHRHWALGDLYIVKGDLEDAQASLNAAMAACKDGGEHPLSYQQGNILRSMGTLHVEQSRADLAIDKFKEAREFHRKAQWVSEQATDLKRLGEAYEMLERAEEAEAAFREAEDLMESYIEIDLLDCWSNSNAKRLDGVAHARKHSMKITRRWETTVILVSMYIKHDEKDSTYHRNNVNVTKRLDATEQVTVRSTPLLTSLIFAALGTQPDVARTSLRSIGS